jgi:hypothetical protein
MRYTTTSCINSLARERISPAWTTTGHIGFVMGLGRATTGGSSKVAAVSDLIHRLWWMVINGSSAVTTAIDILSRIIHISRMEGWRNSAERPVDAKGITLRGNSCRFNSYSFHQHQETEMGYRNITVDGVEHHYTIGRTHVKVQGMQAAPKESIGNVESMSPLIVKVKPHHVADFIRRAA